MVWGMRIEFQRENLLEKKETLFGRQVKMEGLYYERYKGNGW